ncbi:hypothetical protein BRADI_2g11814v3 [Brachypodium distachyon]|uniref:Uncharacterized protein n=1 Tax=Brachypodium distachyon TaxID=15368 RepID=A0A2K2D832_BRADI|nr:hypothetical protein BRADI_2g11814v3 [Brachypodium distachyon]
MLQSHVIQGFWLGLRCDFCNKHFPKHDIAIVLEDEDGHNYDTKNLEEESSNDVKSKEDPKVTRVRSKIVHSDINNLVCESIDGITFSESDIDFDDVASFSNVNIAAGSLVID